MNPLRRWGPAVVAGLCMLVASLQLPAASAVSAAPSSHDAGTKAETDAASSPTCPEPRSPGRDWTLTWHDEFADPRLDRSKWNTVMDFPGRAGGHYHNSSYGSYALDENIVLRKGRLHLLANDEPVVGDDPPGTYAYSEGFMSSHDLFFQAYGYWEICARYPAGRGLWPAFWLVPQDRSWPPEFDIAEWFGGNEGLHQGLATGQWPDVAWHSQWTYGSAPTTGWHTYALQWDPGRAAFFIDGEQTAVFEGSYVPDKAMYVILNSGVWVNDDRGGPPDATTVFPNVFEVDYVRVYQRR
jgi:beta-glucanase (GH16 family)